MDHGLIQMICSANGEVSTVNENVTFVILQQVWQRDLSMRVTDSGYAEFRHFVLV